MIIAHGKIAAINSALAMIIAAALPRGDMERLVRVLRKRIRSYHDRVGISTDRTDEVFYAAGASMYEILAEQLEAHLDRSR